MFMETSRASLNLCARRGVEEYDHPIIGKIVRDASADNQKWSSMILGIVNRPHSK